MEKITFTYSEVTEMVQKLSYVRNVAKGLEKYVARDKNGKQLLSLWSEDSERKYEALYLVLERMVGNDSAEWVASEISALQVKRILSEDIDEKHLINADYYALWAVAGMLGLDESGVGRAFQEGIRAGVEEKIRLRVSAE
jgi:hypothetical protein